VVYRAVIEDTNGNEIVNLGAYSYEWSTGETSPTITTASEGLFSVTVTICDVLQEAGAERSFSDGFKWPNIFFPGRPIEEINGTFGPEVDCPEALTGAYTLEIYNRWGKKVFETDRIQERWSGTLNNQGDFLEEDVYMYQWSYEGGEYMSKHVTLVRSGN